MLAISFDGTSISYDICGAGSAVLLLHGFGNDRRMWAGSGWIERLKPDFTVVTMDFRGCGNSDKPIDSEAYTAEAHCRDIESVLADAGIDNPSVWGWSLGATVALHFAKKGKARRTIAAGTYFGPIFTDSYIDKQLSGATDIVTRSRLNGLRNWPVVHPHEIRNPFLVYTGTEDGNVHVQILKQRQDINAAGGSVEILEGLNHEGLIYDFPKLEHSVVPFLNQNRWNMDSFK